MSLLATNSEKTVVEPAFTVLVVVGAMLGPVPMSAPEPLPVPAAVLVRSTSTLATLVSTSRVVSDLVASPVEVPVTVTV